MELGSRLLTVLLPEVLQHTDLSWQVYFLLQKHLLCIFHFFIALSKHKVFISTVDVFIQMWWKNKTILQNSANVCMHWSWFWRVFKSLICHRAMKYGSKTLKKTEDGVSLSSPHWRVFISAKTKPEPISIACRFSIHM